MSTTDEQYAEILRRRVEAVAPRIDVEVDRVVPRARRRRRTAAGGLGAAALALVLTAGWGAGTVLGVGPSQHVPPAGTAAVRSSVPPPAATDAAPEPAARPTVPAAAVVADDGTVTGVPGDPWDGEEPYWYVLTESSFPANLDGVVTSGQERTESWQSRERPGLVVWDGELGGASAIGPRVVLGSWVVAGVRHDMLADPRVLPTQADELARTIRASLQGDRGQGTDDDKVFEVARTALSEGGLWGQEHRAAFWGVVASLPGVEAEQGQDGAGRTGELLRYTDSGGVVHQLVRDGTTGLLLEESRSGDGSFTRYLEQRPAAEAPLEPTLALAGCATWATC